MTHPRASEEEIEYVLRHVRTYFSMPVERSDVQAAWSGLRPLVSNPKASDTARLSRDHVVQVSGTGLVTIAGGKWTTYRKMAADAIDAAIVVGDLMAGASSTLDLRLVGAERLEATGAGALQERGFASDVARHLHLAYGDRAMAVAELAGGGDAPRLAAAYPYLEAEVIYAARKELAATTLDVLARRNRLATLDSSAARAAAPRVTALLAAELGWDAARCAAETEAVAAWVS